MEQLPAVAAGSAAAEVPTVPKQLSAGPEQLAVVMDTPAVAVVVVAWLTAAEQLQLHSAVVAEAGRRSAAVGRRSAAAAVVAAAVHSAVGLQLEQLVEEPPDAVVAAKADLREKRHLTVVQCCPAAAAAGVAWGTSPAECWSPHLADLCCQTSTPGGRMQVRSQ